MLETLSKNNSLWLKMAYSICRNKDLSNDLVQDMYLKLHKTDKEINNYYVYFTLKSIYIDEVKNSSINNRLVLIDDFSNFQSEFNGYDFEADLNTQNKVDLMQSELDNSKTVKKIIITHSIEKGIRKFSRESGINKSTVQKYRNEFKKQVWQKRKD